MNTQTFINRIDVKVEVPLVDFRELTSDAVTGVPSPIICDRVAAVRVIQVQRFKSAKLTTNAAEPQRVAELCLCLKEGMDECFGEICSPIR